MNRWASCWATSKAPARSAVSWGGVQIRPPTTDISFLGKRELSWVSLGCLVCPGLETSSLWTHMYVCMYVRRWTYPETCNLWSSQLHEDLTHSLDEHILNLVHPTPCRFPATAKKGTGIITCVLTLLPQQDGEPWIIEVDIKSLWLWLLISHSLPYLSGTIPFKLFSFGWCTSARFITANEIFCVCCPLSGISNEIHYMLAN